MTVQCFLVVRVNECLTVVPGKPACCDPPTDDCTPVPDREECLFDAMRTDTQEIVLRHAWHMHGLPAGAMWLQRMTTSHYPTGPEDWPEGSVRHGGEPRSPSYLFADGDHLMVMTPGGLWNIDSRASNCTMPYDYDHRCWVRHGEPPLVTVDKAGATCSAGAGSIQCGNYHGFLRNGFLT